jgi:hypothetical protein
MASSATSPFSSIKDIKHGVATIRANKGAVRRKMELWGS